MSLSVLVALDAQGWMTFSKCVASLGPFPHQLKKTRPAVLAAPSASKELRSACERFRVLTDILAGAQHRSNIQVVI